MLQRPDAGSLRRIPEASSEKTPCDQFTGPGISPSAYGTRRNDREDDREPRATNQHPPSYRMTTSDENIVLPTDPEVVPDDRTRTFRIVQTWASIAKTFLIPLAGGLLLCWLHAFGHVHHGSRSGEPGLVVLFVPFYVLFAQRWIVNAVWPPTLTIDPQGITWQRRGMQPRVMPWGQITRMWTKARIRDARSRTRPERYYIIVETLTDKLRIREGVVNPERDLDVIGRVIDEWSVRFGTGLRIEDRAELMGPWKGDQEEA